MSEEKSKYFGIYNAAKPVTIGNHTFEFLPVEDFQGKQYGILSSKDDDAIEVLESTGAQRMHGIHALSAEDFHKKSKKKHYESANISLVRSRPLKQQQPESETGRVVVAGEDGSGQVGQPGDLDIESILTPKPEGKDDDGGTEQASESGPEQEVGEAERLRAKLDDLGVKYHPKTGVQKLRDRLKIAEAKAKSETKE